MTASSTFSKKNIVIFMKKPTQTKVVHTARHDNNKRRVPYEVSTEVAAKQQANQTPPDNTRAQGKASAFNGRNHPQKRHILRKQKRSLRIESKRFYTYTFRAIPFLARTREHDDEFVTNCVRYQLRLPLSPNT